LSLTALVPLFLCRVSPSFINAFDDFAARTRSLYIDKDIYALASEETMATTIPPVPAVKPDDTPPPSTKLNHDNLESLPKQCSDLAGLASLSQEYRRIHADALQHGREHNPFSDAMEKKFERLYAKLPNKRESACKSEDKRGKGLKIGAYCFTNGPMVSLCIFHDFK